MLNAAARSVPIRRPPHTEQLCKVEEGGNSGGLVLFPLPPRQVCHSPSDLVPAKTEECINCTAEFPSVFVDDFPRGLPSGTRKGGWCFVDIVCLLCLLIWKDSSQSVIERWVKWSKAERFLGSFAWWGELGHRCPFLHRQADALRTRDAFLSISPSNQCNLWLVICSTVAPEGGNTEEVTQQK